MACFGSFWFIVAYFGSLFLVPGLLVKLSLILVRLGLLRVFLAHCDLFWFVVDCYGSFWLVVAYLVSCVLLWAFWLIVVPCGSFCSLWLIVAHWAFQ